MSLYAHIVNDVVAQIIKVPSEQDSRAIDYLTEDLNIKGTLVPTPDSVDGERTVFAGMSYDSATNTFFLKQPELVVESTEPTVETTTPTA